MKFIQDFEETTRSGLNTITDDGKSGMLEETDTLIEPISRNRIVDVINMPWYAGKRVDRQSKRLNKIPRGFIIERKQILNSLLSGALYYLGTVLKTTQKGVKVATPTSVKSMLNKITKVMPKSATAGFTKAKGQFQKTLESDTRLLERNNLTSLLGIYLTQETGFKYVLPYLNSSLDVNTNWADEGDGALAGIVNKGMSIVDEISKVVNISQPGVYIQKPKYFSFDNQGKSVTFNFPLFNTIKAGTFDYKSNYEFLWLLAYQNKPYKTSFARTKPGKIYTVEIPGVVSMPYAYISEMSVDFRGTVRQLPVDCPTEYDAPIPEAYLVSITFTSLLTDYANTMAPDTGFTTTLGSDSATFNFGS
jgi:hypothetical protein